MFNFLLGVACGAAFAPFWIMVWNKIKAYLLTKTKV